MQAASPAENGSKMPSIALILCKECLKSPIQRLSLAESGSRQSFLSDKQTHSRSRINMRLDRENARATLDAHPETMNE